MFLFFRVETCSAPQMEKKILFFPSKIANYVLILAISLYAVEILEMAE